MYRGHTVSVVVPVYNEAAYVGKVLDEFPIYVDKVYVVDDCSTDDTWDRITSRARRTASRRAPSASVDSPTGGTVGTPDGGTVGGPDVVPVRHETNQGRGAAVVTGYERALADGVDVVAVIDGDGQMDPAILDRFLDPIVEGVADYAKGDRLRLPEHRDEMSNWRLFGNTLLTALTRVASGYWGMTDSQNGYTAISREVLATLDLDGLFDGYGFLNDVLVQLNERGARIADVPMRACYGDEESGIRYHTFVPFLSALLLHRFFRRLWQGHEVGPHPQPAGLALGLSLLVGVGGVGGALAGSLLGVGPDAADVVVPALLASFLLVVLAVAMDRWRNRSRVAVFAAESLGNR